jgi:RNA polymerase sigma-70 factor (ECF subfamily)
MQSLPNHGRSPSASRTTADLLAGVREGQEEAAAQLYAAYADRIRALIRRRCEGLLAPRLDPDDVIQSVFRIFIQAVRQGLYQVPDAESLWNLLAVIALNKLRTVSSFHYAARRDVRVTRPLAGPEVMEALMRPGEMDQTVRDILEQLPAACRFVAQLRLEGYEVAEIAPKLALSKRTVERLLQRCRQRLRVLLELTDEHSGEQSGR